MIWCVEDDASIRDIELYALTSTGFEARGFADGTSCWQALQTDRPELVLLDVMLPGMDGVALLRKMKQAPGLCDIPVIMATARGAEYILQDFLTVTKTHVFSCALCIMPHIKKILSTYGMQII